MSCKMPMVSCVQRVWFHTYIGCDVISQVGLITQIHWVSCQIQSLCCHSYSGRDLIYTEDHVKNNLESCNSYSGCDVTSVVYVMSYTVGSVFRNIVDVMS